jgi:D-alanyl-D-alanine carboxypeptidase
MSFRILFILIPLAWLHYGKSFGQPTDRTPDQFLASKMKTHHIPGMSVVVIRKGQIVKKGNYGLANIEFRIPVTDSTVFQLASVTKIFTATLIMKLVEADKLKLEDPVTNYVDSLPETWKAIKIRNLLNHTSGIQNHFQTKNWNALLKDEQDKLTTRQVIQYSADEPLMFPPGQQWAYGVTSYMILGMIAEKASGKSVEALAREWLFTPLRMTRTQYGDYRAVIKNRNPHVYTYQNGPLETWNFTYGLAGTTAAGLNTTTSDLARFFVALDAGRVLSRESMDAMMAPTVLSDGKTKNYGLGWTVDEHRGKAFFGHEGGGCCWVDYYRKEKMTVIVLCNLTGSKADEIVKGLADFYLDK